MVRLSTRSLWLCLRAFKEGWLQGDAIETALGIGEDLRVDVAKVVVVERLRTPQPRRGLIVKLLQGRIIPCELSQTFPTQRTRICRALIHHDFPSESLKALPSIYSFI